MRDRKKRFIQVETIAKTRKQIYEEQLENKIRRLYIIADKIGVKIGDGGGKR